MYDEPSWDWQFGQFSYEKHLEALKGVLLIDFRGWV